MTKQNELTVCPSDPANQKSGSQVFRLPVDAARRKAREVIDQIPQNGLTSIVENWRQLPDGEIEFVIRHIPVPD
jgi:hypothetical protein